ncbi:MAG: hypothetical protein OEY79_01475 [Anaplasmataceae bacterium]|nr:hypothetical protein [Anaplasmataceae bacterium]
MINISILNNSRKKNFKQYLSLSLFIFLNLMIGISRFIATFLNKSHDQKTISHIIYGVIVSILMLLMFIIIFWNIYYRIKSLTKCTDIDQGDIRDINNSFQKINANDCKNISDDIEKKPDEISNNRMHALCQSHPNIVNLFFTLLLMISPLFNIAISIVISEKLIKSNISKISFMIMLSVIGIIASLIADFFVNWVVIYTRQHNKTRTTANLIIFQSAEKNNINEKIIMKSVLVAGFRTLPISIASVAYIITSQLIQNANNKGTIIALTCILLISSIIQIISIVFGCIDYKSTMSEIDSNINSTIKASELLNNKNIDKRIMQLNIYKQHNNVNAKCYLYSNIAICIFLFSVGETGNLLSMLLNKYDIIDQNLSLIITILSSSMALISSLAYALYRVNISEEQIILTSKISELANVCRSKKPEINDVNI